MAEYEDISTGRHCVFVAACPLGFRDQVSAQGVHRPHLNRMEEIMRDVCADFETELREFNGENNHVHLLVNFPPKIALSRLVNSLKGVSSRRCARSSPSWPATTTGQQTVVRLVLRRVGGGAPISVLRQYIEQQNRPRPGLRSTVRIRAHGSGQSSSQIRFTTGLKPGALRIGPVAAAGRPGPDGLGRTRALGTTPGRTVARCAAPTCLGRRGEVRKASAPLGRCRRRGSRPAERRLAGRRSLRCNGLAELPLVRLLQLAEPRDPTPAWLLSPGWQCAHRQKSPRVMIA